MTKSNTEIMTLTTVTAELLRQRPRSVTLTQLAADCDVSTEWLSLLSRNKLPNAAADRVQRVWERLSGRQLLGQ